MGLLIDDPTHHDVPVGSTWEWYDSKGGTTRRVRVIGHSPGYVLLQNVATSRQTKTKLSAMRPHGTTGYRRVKEEVVG